MIRHRQLLVTACLCFPAFFTAAASADLILGTVKSSTTPAAFRDQIKNAISLQVNILANPRSSPQQQQAARDSLIKEVESTVVSVTPEYQAEYALNLGDVLKARLGKDSPPRVRLLGAITAERVAEKVVKASGADGNLAPLAASLLGDQNKAIVLVGMKIARLALADMALANDNGANNGNAIGQLSNEIFKAAKWHPDGDCAPITEEAYVALTPHPPNQNAGKSADIVLPSLLKLLEWRTSQYANGVPPSPLAEQPAMVYLSVWALASVNAKPATQSRALKEVGEFACALLRAIAGGNTDADLVTMTQKTGSAIKTFGEGLNKPGLTSAGQQIADVSAATQATQAQAMCAALAKALKDDMSIDINTEPVSPAPEPAPAGK